MGTFSSSPAESTSKLQPVSIDQNPSIKMPTPVVQKKDQPKNAHQKPQPSKQKNETQQQRQPEKTVQVRKPVAEPKRESLRDNYQPLRIERTQTHIPQQKSEVGREKEVEGELFMRKAEKKEKQVKRKSKALMIEEIESDLDKQTTPQKVVLRKDKKFRPQRIN